MTGIRKSGDGAGMQSRAFSSGCFLSVGNVPPCSEKCIVCAGFRGEPRGIPTTPCCCVLRCACSPTGTTQKENVFEYLNYSVLLLLKSRFASVLEKMNVDMLLNKKMVACHFVSIPPSPKGLFPLSQGYGTQGSPGEPRTSPGSLEQEEEEEMLCG